MVKIELSDDDFLCLKQSLMLLIAMVGATFIDKHTEEEARICNGTIKIHQDLLDELERQEAEQLKSKEKTADKVILQ